MCFDSHPCVQLSLELTHLYWQCIGFTAVFAHIGWFVVTVSCQNCLKLYALVR